MLLLMMAAALAAPTPANWTELVTARLDPLAVRLTPEEEDAAAKAACELGDDLACVWGEETVEAQVKRQCARGRQDACIAMAWLVEKEEPTKAYAKYRDLCATGNRRACADVSRLIADGKGTWPSLRRARMLAEPQCEAGQHHACMLLSQLDARTRPRMAKERLLRADREGFVGALAALADLVDEAERPAILSRGCEAGHGGACRELAANKHDLYLALTRLSDRPDDESRLVVEVLTEAELAEAAARQAQSELRDRGTTEEVEELLHRGCRLGDARACVISVLVRIDEGLMSRQDGLERLDSMCPEFEQACVEANYLRYGGDVRAFKDGTIPLGAIGTHIDVFIPYLIECYRDALDRKMEWSEALTLHWWLDKDGLLKGTAVTSDGDEAFPKCVVDKVLTDRVFRPPPVGGAASAEMDLRFNHEADFLVRSDDTDVLLEPAVALQNHARDNWAEQVDDCYLEHGGSAYDSVFMLQNVEVRRDGTVRVLDVQESSGFPEVDACIQDLIAAVDLEQTFEYHQELSLYARFAYAFREPRSRGMGHGDAADPETYMYRDGDGIPLKTDFD